MSAPDRSGRAPVRGRVWTARDAGRARTRSWHAQMLAEAGDGTRRGTRWGRGSLTLAPATAVVAALGLAIAQGVLAASFNVANEPFTLNVAELDGTGLGGVLAAADVKDADAVTGTTGVLHAGLASAELAGLCIVVNQSMLGVKYSITVGAGGSERSTGSNLFFDITDLNASPATLRGAVLGVSADEVAVNGTPLGGAPGGFGLDVTRGTVNLRDVKASAYQAQVAGALTLPNLGINVTLGDATGC